MDGTLTRRKAPPPPSREFDKRKDFVTTGDRPVSDPVKDERRNSDKGLDSRHEEDKDLEASRRSSDSKKVKPPVPNRPSAVKQQKPVSPSSGSKPPLSPKPGKQREVTYL